MNKASFYRFVNSIGRKVNRNSPKLLVALGIGGGVTAAVMAVKATPNYIYESERYEDAEPKTKAKIFIHNYGPSIGVGVGSAAAIIFAQKINNDRIAGFAAAYKLSETALRELQDKVVEKVGEKKAKQIKESIMEDRVRNGYPTEADLANEPKDAGDYICWDLYTGKFFYSTQAKLNAAAEKVNNRLKEDGDFVSLSEFFDLIERNCDCAAGRYMGWTYVNQYTPVHFNTSQTIPTPNPDLPHILVLDYTDMLTMNPDLKRYEDFARCRG